MAFPFKDNYLTIKSHCYMLTNLARFHSSMGMRCRLNFKILLAIAYIQLFFSNPSERFGEFGHVRRLSVGGVDFCQKMIIAA
jgi:hypothetical protein